MTVLPTARHQLRRRDRALRHREEDRCGVLARAGVDLTIDETVILLALSLHHY